MDKNSFPEAKQLWKNRLALFLLLAIIAGMLGARFVASLATILFGLNALWDIHPRNWLRQRWCLFGIAWVALYGISFFWSADKAEWFSHLQVKFPFLFLPLAFAFLPKFTPAQLRAFTWGLAALMCSGVVYSLSFLWRTSSADMLDAYKHAHVLPTPFYNDHIAFSVSVALTVAWTVYMLPAFRSQRYRVILISLVIGLAAYLHVLAAKTGLLALYVLLAGMIILQFRAAPRRGMLMLTGAVLAVVVAFLSLPTLRERAGYSLVTWRSYTMGERTGVYSDAGRIMSYHLALRSIATHPVIGVGAGDVFEEMKDGYRKHYPAVPAAQQLWPHNQFLTAAMSAGIPAAILLLAWFAAPLFKLRRGRSGHYFTIVWVMLLIPLMIDLFLEVQFGTAVFLIFLLLQRKVMLDSDSFQPSLSEPEINT